MRFLRRAVSTVSCIMKVDRTYPSKANFVPEMEKSADTILALNVIVKVDETKSEEELATPLTVVQP